MTTDDDLLELAYPYALDALDESEQKDVRLRLANASETLRAEFDQAVRDVRETLAAMSASAAVAPPAGLRESVLSAIGEPTLAKVIPLRRPRWQLLAAGVAAVFALLAGSMVAVNVMNRPSEVTVAQSVESASDKQVRKVTIAGGGILEVSFSRQLDAAVVRFESADTVPAGKAYQLWYMDNGKAKSAGVVDDPTNDVTVEHLGTSSAIALTIEPANGSIQPTMNPIAVASL